MGDMISITFATQKEHSWWTSLLFTERNLQAAGQIVHYIVLYILYYITLYYILY